jgi:cytochrome c
VAAVIRSTPIVSDRRIAASTGRKAGSAPNFNYSSAVKNSSVMWEETTLDAWLTNPQALIPGQRMNFRVAAAEDRADIIAYLRQQSGK